MPTGASAVLVVAVCQCVDFLCIGLVGRMDQRTPHKIPISLFWIAEGGTPLGTLGEDAM